MKAAVWLGARAADSCGTSQAAVSKWALSLYKMDAQQLSNSRAAVGSGANFQGSQFQNHCSQSCHLRDETQPGRSGKTSVWGHPCSQPLPRTRFGASRTKHVGGTPVLWMWARVKPNLADVLASEVLVVASQLIPLWPREDGKLRNGKYLEGGFMFSSWETDFPCSGWIAPST